MILLYHWTHLLMHINKQLSFSLPRLKWGITFLFLYLIGSQLYFIIFTFPWVTCFKVLHFKCIVQGLSNNSKSLKFVTLCLNMRCLIWWWKLIEFQDRVNIGKIKGSFKPLTIFHALILYRNVLLVWLFWLWSWSQIDLLHCERKLEDIEKISSLSFSVYSLTSPKLFWNYLNVWPYPCDWYGGWQAIRSTIRIMQCNLMLLVAVEP